MALKSSLGSQWNCPGCGARLEFDPGRRLNVAGFASLLGGGPAVIGATTGAWWLVGLGVIVFAFILSFDAVRLKDGGGPAGADRG
jgi:hypothetical protein